VIAAPGRRVHAACFPEEVATMPKPDERSRPAKQGGGSGKNAGAADTPSPKRQHTEDLLDEALDESFPASDPPSITVKK
jgi:hypothetical protein